MRRGWLAPAIGLAIAGALAAATYTMITRQIPNGHETLSPAAAYPRLLYPGLPGILLFFIAIWTTGIDWNLHPMLARVVVSAGNAMFYSAAAYVVLRMSARLSARWKQ